jgi:hypothetical protein
MKRLHQRTPKFSQPMLQASDALLTADLDQADPDIQIAP